ncbi:MAG: TRASH domain-containing protein [Candidatus Brocadiaceae bacterium]
MKRIGYYLGVGSITFVLMTSYAVNKVFAGDSCCGAKAAAAGEKAENKCLVCGKAIDVKGKPVTIEHEGKTLNFCCEHCADTFKKDPGKCLKDEGKQK